MAKTFYVDGTAGVVAIGNSTTITSAIANPSNYLTDLNFHSSLNYLQVKSKIVLTSASFAGFAQEYIYWDDGGCDCFTPDSLVTLPDGSTKPIIEINVGDKILGTAGTINTVTFIEKVPDSLWKFLYSPDPKLKPFATVNHPIYINNVLVAVDPVAVWDLYPWLGKPEQLLGYKLAPATGNFVYNLWLTGDGTYTVNGYKTTSIMFTGDFLARSFSKNWLTQQEVVGILTYFTSLGKHTQYGAYLINKTLMYVKINFLHKFIALQLRKEKSLIKSAVALIAKALGRIFHPNR